jgi:hypothetical protein
MNFIIFPGLRLVAIKISWNRLRELCRLASVIVCVGLN